MCIRDRLYAADGRLDRALILAVNSDARVWLLFRVGANGLETISGPTYHEAIHPGQAANRLAMARRSGRLQLSVNGAAVGDVADPLAGTPVVAGLVAASYTCLLYTSLAAPTSGRRRSPDRA